MIKAMKRLTSNWTYVMPLTVAVLVLTACSSPIDSAVEEPATVATSSQQSATDGGKLNLNIVSGDELQSTIPDFGGRMVREFHEYRPYVSIQQFRREIGKYVDEATVAGYEQYVYVPIDANESDAATLMQIPGLAQDVAEELMAGRPFESNEAFLAMLTEKASTEVAESATALLAE